METYTIDEILNLGCSIPYIKAIEQTARYIGVEDVFKKEDDFWERCFDDDYEDNESRVYDYAKENDLRYSVNGELLKNVWVPVFEN